jgi:L-lactate dehydrogenase
MKISVVGVGRVGTATAFSLVARAVPHELVLVGRTKDRTIGDAHDLQHAAAFVRPMRVVAGDVADTAGSDVVILAASAASGTVSDRREQADPNARLLREIVPPLASASPRAVFVVLTNPVDVCTYVTLRSSGLPPGQVMGSGTLVDTARLRAHLAREVGINAQDIRAYVLGEHGESQFPALSVASVGGLSLDRKDEAMRQIVEEARDDGHRVVRAKGYTNYAVALSATMICEAIREDASTILPVSALIDGYKGVSDVCLSLPCVVGRGGVLRVMPVDLDDEEVDQFRRSASVVRGVLDRLD